MANYLDENGLRTLVDRIKDNFVPYTGANKDINIGNHSFKMSSVFTVGSESSVYTQTTPGSISLKNPIGTLSMGISSLTVNGTTIYWPTVSADPNGKYLALRSDIPSIDDHLSATSTNAVQNKVVNSTISELSYQLAMVRENLFQTVLSEIDYTEDFATLYPIPDTLSDVDGTHRVLFSDTQLREVAGNSIAYNQNSKITRTPATIGGITFATNDDGSLSISGTSTKEENIAIGTFAEVSGHKFLANADFITGKPTASSGYWIKWKSVGYGKDYGDGMIFTANGTGDANVIFTVDSANTVVNSKLLIQLFDLTLMGLDSVSTVEEARSELLKRGIDIDQYNPYSEGEIRNTTAGGVKVNGYNLFDGEWTGTSQKISANFIKVIQGQTYTLEVLDLTTTYKILQQYDANQSLIKNSYLANTNQVNSITLENSTCYVKLELRFASATDIPLNAVAFHLTGSRTGYAPYKEPKAISFASTELLGAGEAHDTIEVVEGDKVAGIQRYNLVQVKRVGTVDLGTLNWTYYGDTEKFFLSEGIANLIKPIEYNGVVANLVCSKYRTNNFNSILEDGTDKIIAQTYSNQLVEVKDSSYTDATAFKTAMNGVILNYELATPTRTTIAENLTFEEVSATIEQGGSIETIYETLAPNCTTGFVVKKATEVSK